MNTTLSLYLDAATTRASKLVYNTTLYIYLILSVPPDTPTVIYLSIDLHAPTLLAMPTVYSEHFFM